ncbi:pyridoxamine 5'-phosphate oxidase family protein [Bacteroides sp. 519]|nr:pyridoxamine 5'-phosphate oxidase family protein [Bacteroides sp. 519]
MQGRMKKYQISFSEIEEILKEQKVGRLATQNSDGYPYVTPVHFVYENNRIYIHGLSKGQKIGNINNNPKVCFETEEMLGLILDEKPCDVNTAYKSVIIVGNAKLVEGDEKTNALKAIVSKYTPHLAEIPFPDNMLKATSVIEIEIVEATGKKYE